MSVDMVYSKTEAGRSEFARRSLGLNGRQRSILVMVDGHRGCAELALAMPDGVVEGILGELLARGLIVAGDTAAVDTAAVDTVAVDTAAASPVDPQALAKAVALELLAQVCAGLAGAGA